jgi:hypothetical protein
VAAGDLMEALRRSLQGGGGSAARRPSGSSGSPRAKAPAKTARRSPAHRKAG